MVDWNLHIESNPDKLYGKPVIKGTRIPVDIILEKLANGDSMEDLLEAFPKLSNNDIYACLIFASDAIKNEIIYSRAS
ncbi:MAG: DUF433 domain-containing protein [Bacteroidetes bacterium]|jgi:uncharacterized protein (DUF433 family)|nr:DUF433 domain-containing protein [Bacteroidota bacterium]